MIVLFGGGITMAWVPGYIRFDISPERQRLFKGDIVLTRNDDLVIYGVIKESKGNKPVPGALVNIMARSAGGKELPLSHSYSGSDGHYLLTVNKRSIPRGSAIFIRAKS